MKKTYKWITALLCVVAMVFCFTSCKQHDDDDDDDDDDEVVVETKVSISSLSITGSDFVPVGKMISLTASKNDSANTGSILWSVSDDSVASIFYTEDKCIVTGVSEGETVVYAYSSENASVYAKQKITVQDYSSEKEGTLTGYGDYVIYKFNADSDEPYSITLTDGSGADMRFSASFSSSSFSKSSDDTLFYDEASGTKTFTPTKSSTVYVKVTPYDSDGTGSYTLKVSGKTQIKLEQDSIKIYSATLQGTFTRKDEDDYKVYSFYAEEKETYKISWTCEDDEAVKVSAKGTYYGWTGSTNYDYFSDEMYSSKTITPERSQYIFITVKPSDASNASFSLTVSCTSSIDGISLLLDKSVTNKILTLNFTLPENHYYTYRTEKFYATAGRTYTINWNNTSNVSVSAGTSSSSLTDYFSENTSGSYSITPDTSGYVYVRLTNTGGSNTGSVTLSATYKLDGLVYTYYAAFD